MRARSRVRGLQECLTVFDAATLPRPRPNGQSGRKPTLASNRLRFVSAEGSMIRCFTLDDSGLPFHHPIKAARRGDSPI